MSYSIVIPSKTSENLEACVSALSAAGEAARVIVIDNGLSRRPEGCEYIDYEGPFIFSKAINIGIRAAGDDDVVLLNDDGLLKSPNGIARMAAAMASRPHVGLCAAACDTVGNPNQFQRAENVDKDAMRGEERMVCFVCVYVPRTTIDTVGLLDERFVDYGLDDDDYSFRVRAAGLKIGIFDGCYVDHASLKSTYRGDALAGGDFTANMRRFIEKWGTDNWGCTREKSGFANLFPEAK